MRASSASRATLAAILMAAPLTFVLPNAASASNQIVAGACSLTLEGTASSTSINFSTPSPGDCVLTNVPALGTIHVSGATLDPFLSGDTFDCHEKTADGNVTFDVTSFPIGSVNANLVYAQGVITLVLHRTEGGTQVAGVGTFAQVEPPPDVCPPDGDFEWEGAIVFEDPEI